MTQATRALQSHDLSGQGINSGSHTYFLTTQGHGGPPRMSDQLNAGTTFETTQSHLRDNTYMKDDTHHPRTRSFQQGKYERMIMMAK